MADDQKSFGLADLRAAVAAGIVTESQAAGLIALATDRAGKRLAMPAESLEALQVRFADFVFFPAITASG